VRQSRNAYPQAGCAGNALTRAGTGSGHYAFPHVRDARLLGHGKRTKRTPSVALCTQVDTMPPKNKRVPNKQVDTVGFLGVFNQHNDAHIDVQRSIGNLAKASCTGEDGESLTVPAYFTPAGEVRPSVKQALSAQSARYQQGMRAAINASALTDAQKATLYACMSSLKLSKSKGKQRVPAITPTSSMPPASKNEATKASPRSPFESSAAGPSDYQSDVFLSEENGEDSSLNQSSSGLSQSKGKRRAPAAITPTPSVSPA
jgi:hypothetical protein